MAVSSWYVRESIYLARIKIRYLGCRRNLYTCFTPFTAVLPSFAGSRPYWFNIKQGGTWAKQYGTRTWLLTCFRFLPDLDHDLDLRDVFSNTSTAVNQRRMNHVDWILERRQPLCISLIDTIRHEETALQDTWKRITTTSSRINKSRRPRGGKRTKTMVMSACTINRAFRTNPCRCF